MSNSKKGNSWPFEAGKKPKRPYESAFATMNLLQNKMGQLISFDLSYLLSFVKRFLRITWNRVCFGSEIWFINVIMLKNTVLVSVFIALRSYGMLPVNAYYSYAKFYPHECCSFEFIHVSVMRFIIFSLHYCFEYSLHSFFFLGRNFVFFALAFLIVTTSFGLLEIDLIKFSP